MLGSPNFVYETMQTQATALVEHVGVSALCSLRFGRRLRVWSADPSTDQPARASLPPGLMSRARLFSNFREC
jgi:hypothetical protein